MGSGPHDYHQAGHRRLSLPGSVPGHETPAQAEVREDNEQLPQHGIDPEQRLKYRKAGQSVMGAKPVSPSWYGVGPGDGVQRGAWLLEGSVKQMEGLGILTGGAP